MKRKSLYQERLLLEFASIGSENSHWKTRYGRGFSPYLLNFWNPYLTDWCNNYAVWKVPSSNLERHIGCRLAFIVIYLDVYTASRTVYGVWRSVSRGRLNFSCSCR
jgi:hypothetical protein